MPIYEYLCTQCGERTEIKASVAEKEKGLKVACPRCGSKKMAQVFGGFITLSSSQKESNLPACGPQCGPGCSC